MSEHHWKEYFARCVMKVLKIVTVFKVQHCSIKQVLCGWAQVVETSANNEIVFCLSRVNHAACWSNFIKVEKD